MLASFGIAPRERPEIFICGPTPLVEQTARSMLALGHQPNLIKTERFGPTG
jgi:ferredoxin-NADP reductase